MRKVLFIILALFFVPFFVQAYSPNGYVNDFAGVIDDGIEQQLEQKLDAFEKSTSNEISVVTINSLEGDVIENFAVDLFADWGIGKKDKDNGVLVLAAIDDRKMRIEVGYGLEGALTDAQSFWIINEVMKPAFKQGDYYAGFNGAVDKIMAATQGEYVPSASEKKKTQGGFKFGDIFWLIMFLPMWLASVLGRSKSWWAGGVIGFIGGGIVYWMIGGVLGALAVLALTIFGLIFDFLVSRAYGQGEETGNYPWWIGGGPRGGSGGGFGGFGGGMSGGGGASGEW